MNKLISLAVVVAFFVAIPQCFGQSQDAEKDASQLLEEQQLVQMFQLAMLAKETKCKDGFDNDLDGATDCEDSDCSSKGFCKGEDPEPAGTILICHFSPNGRHCEGEGGLPWTNQSTQKSPLAFWPCYESKQVLLMPAHNSE